MPSDAHDGAYRLAAACALAFALASARNEANVVAAALTIRARATTREFINELQEIRNRAQARAFTIAVATAGALVATKPSERSFAPWFARFASSIAKRESSETDSDGESATRWVARWYRAYARAAMSDGDERGVSGVMKKMETFANALAKGRLGGREIKFEDWFVTRVATVDETTFFVGVANLWWGPFPTVARSKKAAKEFVEMYGDRVAAAFASGLR